MLKYVRKPRSIINTIINISAERQKLAKNEPVELENAVSEIKFH